VAAAEVAAEAADPPCAVAEQRASSSRLLHLPVVVDGAAESSAM
jgi:hypothetical protein